MKSKRFFPGWFIVLGGFLMMATCYTVFVNCMGLFQIPITKDLGITRTAFSVTTSISALVGMVASLVVGKVIDKFDCRVIGGLCIGIATLDLVGWSFVTQVWQMYALAFLTGFCVVAGTRLLISILIANWFDKNRGLAVSLALMGSGVGGVVLTPIVARLITTSGWRPTFLILAVIVFVAGMPLAVTMFRNNPSDIGLKPYGAEEIQKDNKSKDTSKSKNINKGISTSISINKKKESPVTIDIGWKIVRKSLALWMLVLGFLFMGLINGSVIFNIAAQMTDAGHTAPFVATIISTELFIVIIGKVLLGTIYDRFGLYTGTIFGSITSIIGVIALLFAKTTVGPFVFAIAFGFGTCLATVGPPLMVTNEFGKKDLGFITGVITAASMLGTAIGSPMMGSIYDSAGSYSPGWIFLAGIGVLMLITLLLSVKLAKDLVAGLESSKQPKSFVAAAN